MLNKNPGIKLFVLKVTLFLTPVWLLVGFYFIDDPFRVIWRYTNYYPVDKNYLGLNTDFVSTEIFKTGVASANYDSFIFGSSRSMFYEADDWKEHIGKHASVLHFDASGESLFGINAKIKLVAKNHRRIKNALVIVDHGLLAKNDPDESASEGYLFIKHPDLSGSSRFLFHLEFMEAFFNRDFLKAYMDFRITKKYKPYMQNVILNKRSFIYDPVTNEVRFEAIEKEIKDDFSGYYQRMADQFPQRTDTTPYDSALRMDTAKAALLTEMASILKADDTNVKIIVSPLYNQKKMSVQDIVILEECFGAANVFDFSGKSSITEWKGNYYDQAHYRPHVSRLLLDDIYNDLNTNNLEVAMPLN
jgi:hypothetical protein